MRIVRGAVLCWILSSSWLMAPSRAEAQTLNQEMAALAASLSKAIAAQGFKNVAAIDFTDLQGQPTELGRYLSERLAVEMVSAGGASVLDRANIKSILAEHKLTEEGLVNPANAKKLGEFAGVDVILIGNVTTLEGVELMVKGISTESARIVAAGRIAFPKTPDIQQLLNRGISPPPSIAGPTNTGGRVTARLPGAGIGFKEIGSLRFILKSCISVRGVSPAPGWGAGPDGIRCSFELSNLATQYGLVVALNASAPHETALCNDYDVGQFLRTTLIDDEGTQWILSNAGVTGLGVVGVGKKGGGCADAYNPTEIATLIPTFDETGSSRARSYQGDYSYMFGSLTTVSPGQSRAVSMTFTRTDREPSRKPPKFFELQSELVIGVTTSGDSKRSYSLENITLEHVDMPAGVR
jgi:hypothetical protein